MYTKRFSFQSGNEGLITFMPFHVPCHMIHEEGGVRFPGRCRVKAALPHTYTTLPQVAPPHKVFVTF